jgi:predicted membrane protein
MFCPKCGAQSDSGKFCRSCGTNLTRVSEIIQEPRQRGVSTVARSGVAATVGLFFGASVSNKSRQLDGLNAGAIFGGVMVDLTAAALPAGETKISVFSIFGGAEVLVPDDVGIRITGFTCLAGATVRGEELSKGIFTTFDYVSDNYEQASRRLHIDATSVFAGLEIKSRD